MSLVSGRPVPIAAGVPAAALAPRAARSGAAAAALFLLVLLDAAWWARAIPENGAPDEYEHIATQRFVAERGRLPSFGEGRFRIHLMDSVCRVPIDPSIVQGRMIFPAGTEIHPAHRYEVRQPYLFWPQPAHLIAGTLLRVTGGFSLWKARAISSCWVAAAAVLIFLAALRLWPDRLALASLAGVTFGLWPQVTFVGAYVNDDAPALATTALLLLVCTLLETDGVSTGRNAALGLALGLVALSKPYACAVLPLVGFWIIRSRATQGKGAVRSFLLSGAVALAVVGAWFLFAEPPPASGVPGGGTRSAALQDFTAALPPDLAGQTTLLETGSMLRTGRGILEFPLIAWLLPSLFSLYGAFGWMDEPLPLLIYALAALVFSISLAGHLIGGPDRRPPALRLPFLFSFPLLAIGGLLSFWHSYAVDFQPQGRYLLPSVSGLSMLAAAGAVAFTGRLGLWAPALLAAFVTGANLLARLAVLR